MNGVLKYHFYAKKYMQDLQIQGACEQKHRKTIEYLMPNLYLHSAVLSSSAGFAICNLV